MELHDFLNAMEQIAPRALAMDFDNPGLLVGPDHTELHRVLVAMDCTPAVAREAVAWKADLVLTHHPLFFHGIKQFLPEDPATAAAYVLVQNGIGMFAAHTNLDAAEGGVNDTLCDLFCLEDVVPFDEMDIGRVGTLQERMPLLTFAKKTEKILDVRVQYCGEPDKPVQRVAVLGGAGGGSLLAAKQAGADVLLTGELKHNEGIDANTLGLGVVAAGHQQSERVVLLPLIARLQRVSDDVQYLLARSDVSPFVQL